MTHERGHGGLPVLSLAVVLACAGTAASQDEGTARQRAELEQKAKTLLRQSEKLRGQDRLEEATEAARQALALCRQLYPKKTYPDGRPDLAASLNQLGILLRARGEYDQAEPLLREALAMRRRLYPKEHYPDGHPALATSLNNLGFLLRARGEY